MLPVIVLMAEKKTVFCSLECVGFWRGAGRKLASGQAEGTLGLVRAESTTGRETPSVAHGARGARARATRREAEACVTRRWHVLRIAKLLQP